MSKRKERQDAKMAEKEKKVKWNAVTSYNLADISEEFALSKGVEVYKSWKALQESE